MKKLAAVLLAFCMLLSAVCAAAEGGAAEDYAGRSQRIRKEASSRIFAR